jgi:hypothetical protein
LSRFGLSGWVPVARSHCWLQAVPRDVIVQCVGRFLL